MSFRTIAVLLAALASAQTTTNLVTPASSPPAATLAKSADIGGGKFVISTFDPGRRLAKSGTVPVARSPVRYNIALLKMAPLATFAKSGDIGGGKFVISVFDPGHYLFKNVVWYASGAGPPLVPPARDGINNPLVFR